MNDYRKIQVWQRSHKLVLQVYKLTRNFPAEELYGLTSQLRRASVSVPSNIAEGCGRSTQAELARFIDISLGSLNETEYLLFLSYELSYFEKDGYLKLSGELVEIRKMLTAFLKTVRSKKRK